MTGDGAPPVTNRLDRVIAEARRERELREQLDAEAGAAAPQKR